MQHRAVKAVITLEAVVVELPMLLHKTRVKVVSVVVVMVEHKPQGMVATEMQTLVAVLAVVELTQPQ